MLPRGRSKKKVGQLRADAALDAMRAFGFPYRVIRETLKELLIAYGDDGWVFIEDGCYSVLLEALLAKGEKANQQKKEDAQDAIDEQYNKSAPNKAVNSAGSNCVTGRFDVEVTKNEETPERRKRINASVRGDGNTSSFEHNANTHMSCSSRNCTASPKPVDSTPTKRHKPCYGWISSDEDSDDSGGGGGGFVELTPRLCELLRNQDHD